MGIEPTIPVLPRLCFTTKPRQRYNNFLSLQINKPRIFTRHQHMIPVKLGGMQPAETSITNNSSWRIIQQIKHDDLILSFMKQHPRGNVIIIDSNTLKCNNQIIEIVHDLKFNSSYELCVWTKRVKTYGRHIKNSCGTLFISTTCFSVTTFGKS